MQWKVDVAFLEEPLTSGLCNSAPGWRSWQQGQCRESRFEVCSFRTWNAVYFIFILATLCSFAPRVICDYAPEQLTIGVDYGLVADNLPAPAVAVNLITGLGIGRVRLYDPDAASLTALGGSGLEVVIGMSNLVIPSLANSTVTADQWILQNVVPYVPKTNITTILLGNELFGDSTLSAVWLQLVPAMQNLHTSLVTRGLSSIRLSTAAELNTLSWSYPPSAGVFRSDIAVPVLTPLFQFLNDTGSYFYVNVYPYFGWADDSSYIPLSYALFTNSTPFIVDGNHSYNNLLDAQLDAIAAAMEKLGFADVRIAISETGWPTTGAYGNTVSNTSNAQTFNTNLLDNILSTPTKGTPRRPGIFIPTYIFSLFNEDLKPGGVAEQHWGILDASGTQVYALDLEAPTTTTSNTTSRPVAAPSPAALPATDQGATGPASGPIDSPLSSSGTRTDVAHTLGVLVTSLAVLVGLYGSL